MQRQKTMAVMIASVMGVTATAYALNVGVINATRPKPAVASAAGFDPGGGTSAGVAPNGADSIAALLAAVMDQEPVSVTPTYYETFSAGSAGDVVLAHTGNTIKFWAAYTANGWKYQVEVARGQEVVLKYRLGTTEETFIAKVEGDRIDTTVGRSGGATGDIRNG